MILDLSQIKGLDLFQKKLSIKNATPKCHAIQGTSRHIKARQVDAKTSASLWGFLFLTIDHFGRLGFAFCGYLIVNETSQFI